MITKELFIETISVIQKQLEKDELNSEKLSEVFESYVSPYGNSSLYDQLIKLLHHNFNIEKTEHGSDIEYFIWELDFGKRYTEGCYTIHGEDVSLATSEDLWNLLNREDKKDPTVHIITWDGIEYDRSSTQDEIEKNRKEGYVIEGNKITFDFRK